MQNNKEIIIGSDHAGFLLKQRLIKYLSDLGCKVNDTGVYSEESSDYPITAKQTAKEAVSKQIPAVLICGTGIGMSIAANKIKGARAALCCSEETAKLSRLHNDANILCLGARFIQPEQAEKILKTWLETGFEGGRHKRRIDLIEAE